MNKAMKLFRIIAVLIIPSALLSQIVNPCATDAAMKRYMERNPASKEAVFKFKAYRASIDYNTLRGAKAINSTAQYTIPIVFHILHTGGPENISDQQVQDAVKILNMDFRKKNADTAAIIPLFKQIAADVSVEFILATKDPLGNCTNGIVHHYDVNTQWQGNFQDYIYTWDNTKYLNIYVVASIGFGAAGYTYLPGTASPQEDAIVILHSYVGSIGTSNVVKSRALTHEVGHWFGLEHVWGWSNNPGVSCGDDGIPDTPLTKGHTSCQLTSAACTQGVVENVQNYMEYAYCSNMFTTDQASLMQTVLNDPWLDRKTLFTPANLAFTGVTNPSTCVPLCNFNSVNNKYELCAGNNLTFKDMSTNAVVSSYSWTATGSATIASPTASSTAIYFPIAGTYSVTLKAQNSAGFSTSTKTVVALNSTANYVSAYTESFETSLTTPQFWSVINNDLGTTWQAYAGAGSNGTNSFYIEGAANPPAQTDILQTGIFNLQSNPTASLTFDVSYARNSNVHNDIFKVQGSKDCGGSWLDLYVPSMASLAAATGGVSSGSLQPLQSQWKTVALQDHPNFAILATESSVIFRFLFTEDNASGYGNRIFIDNINFAAPAVGLSESGLANGFMAFPNPAKEKVNIQINLNDKTSIECKLVDINGRVLCHRIVPVAEAGPQNIEFEGLDKFAPGIYFIELSERGFKHVKKLQIN